MLKSIQTQEFFYNANPLPQRPHTNEQSYYRDTYHDTNLDHDLLQTCIKGIHMCVSIWNDIK